MRIVGAKGVSSRAKVCRHSCALHMHGCDRSPRSQCLYVLDDCVLCIGARARTLTHTNLPPVHANIQDTKPEILSSKP